MNKPTKPLEQWADEKAEARFVENRDIAQRNTILARQLAARSQEMEALRTRLRIYEHPSSLAVEQALLTQPTLSREQVAALLSVGLEGADAVLVDMSARGYNVVDGVISRLAGGPRATVEHFYGDVVRFGIVSDTHIGNRHSMEEQLQEAYAVFQKEGITAVYAPGNLLDGEKTYRGQEYEITVMGADAVVENLARVWPSIPGITTYHVASSTCHEGFYFKNAGLLIGKMIQGARPDMVYLGLDEADVVIHDSEARPTLRIIHPGGGSSYADSYRPQKIVESYGGGEKPTVLAIGHYHKASFNDIRDVQVVQAGCLERQTPFMRKLSLKAAMGFWIVEAHFSEHGSLRRFKTEWFKYYVGDHGQVLRDWRV
jgi:predicted phosphodiesterase